MTQEEKFQFDLEGYLVIKGVLSESEAANLNTLADEAFPDEFDDKGLKRTSRVSLWGPRFRDLIDHAALVPYLLELLGPKVRIDHDYCIFMRQGAERGRLHGGPTMQGGVPGDHWYAYHDGVMRNGLTVFTYCLSPAGPGDGGFACIPGSHKSNFLTHIPDDVRSFERRPRYVAQPEAETGDVIVFTEALVHGTMPWTADHERRALLFKYSPGHSSWAQTYYDPDEYPGLSDQQRRLMAAPSIGQRPDTVEVA